MNELVENIRRLGQDEAEVLLHRVFGLGRNEQWS